ncbi:MAG: TolC family protein, partial [Cyanobacteria bacterium P01_F01_bin.3]
MRYIKPLFLIRIATLGGLLSLLPLPTLASVLTDELNSRKLDAISTQANFVSHQVTSITNLIHISQLPDLPENEAVEAGSTEDLENNADSTAEEDLLDERNLPSTDLLADPNPLSVPTLESEVFLPEGDEQTISLEDAIELAYVNNQDLKAALLELEQAEATLAEARAAFSPTLITSADVTAQESDSQTLFGTTTGEDEIDTSLNASLQVSYDIFTSGQRIATVRAAKEQVRLNTLEVDRRREELRLETTSLYYDLQESGEQIRINRSFVEEAQRNQRDNELRRQAGVGTQFDVLRADVQLANAQQ